MGGFMRGEELWVSIYIFLGVESHLPVWGLLLPFEVIPALGQFWMG